ncbi:glycosyltransferase family 31 [Fusarium subglutinans]|uniref:Glycosyltransferase family 31 n=1 Tax=Gibberella subglutinans TaxID=42677 RepID=A0A8H5P5F2_GIBSU|nr:glycosyltransferase family 31 [Fusarium subglutinans]KAF5590559.1 glycosyltransferase family 31 [Fusarium subglutinans]
MMFTTYRENRILPPSIIAICLALYCYLLNSSVERLGARRLPDNPQSELKTNSLSEPTHQSLQMQPDGHGKLDGSDVLLILKTGGTSMYHRLLIHLVTSLSQERINPQNVVIYSDYEEAIGNFTTIDVLKNMTEAIKSHPDFDVYHALPQYVKNNVYVESANIEGDHEGPVGGWVIDKYKFLPIMDHAGKNWPHARWYIFMEDDAYIFLPNVLDYLSSFDWKAPHYLGSSAFLANVTFAHGGSAFALSRGAWEMSFGKNSRLFEDFAEYTRQHGCGDHILGRALNEYGIRFGENGGDEKFTWGFNAVVHWKFGFSSENWCTPLLSWHKAHSRDIARYYQLEKNWDFKRPMLFKDFFTLIIAPDLGKRREWWDNLSSLFDVTSANANSPPAPHSNYDRSLWANAWKSADACEAACESWDECMQWSYYDDLCRMDDKLTMGSGFAPGMYQRRTRLLITSGWLLPRIKNWECK